MTLSCGTILVQRPRVRDAETRVERRVRPLCKRTSRAVERLLPELYVHGLAQGDFELALRGLLGEGRAALRADGRPPEREVARRAGGVASAAA